MCVMLYVCDGMMMGMKCMFEGMVKMLVCVLCVWVVCVSGWVVGWMDVVLVCVCGVMFGDV